MSRRRRNRNKSIYNKVVDPTIIDNKEVDDSELAFNMDSGNIISLSAGRPPIPKLPGTLSLSLPHPEDYEGQAKLAILYRGVKFVRGALLRRRKFIISGFRHHHSDPKVETLFDNIVKDTKFVKTLKSIQWEKDTVGWVVVWPDEINLFPQSVNLLQGNIRLERFLGQDRIFLKLDTKNIEAVRKNPERFPDYFLAQLNNERDINYRTEIELQGAYLVSVNRDIGAAYPKSPMYPLFEPIMIIENLIEAEFAISFAVKQLIMHVKVQGELDVVSGKPKRANMSDIKSVGKLVLNGAKTANIVTDAGVSIDFISPDKAIFEATKTPYEQALDRIKDNIGIPMLMVSGKADGISYSTATFIIKAFLQDIIDEREDLLLDFIYPWYNKIAEKLYYEDPKKYAFLKKKDPLSSKDQWNIPIVQFNETELKNIVELLAVLKFLQDTGSYSMESTFEQLQLDFETEKSRKENQNKDDGYIYRPFEASQGMAHSESFENPQQQNIKLKQDQLKLDGKIGLQKVNISNPGQAGRPVNDTKAPSPNNETRNPRASTVGEELTIDKILEFIDEPELLNDFLIQNREFILEKIYHEEDINEE